MSFMKKVKRSTVAAIVATVAAPYALLAQPYAQMSCYDLWYARNSIFANKGYCFSSARSINTFGRRCYPPYGQLNDWENRQVEEIKYWERTKGCRGGYGASTPPPSYGTGRYARVYGIRWDDTLAVRTGPSTRYRRIGDLPPNASGIEILECRYRWCRIRYGNLTGWSSAKYLRSY